MRITSPKQTAFSTESEEPIWGLLETQTLHQFTLPRLLYSTHECSCPCKTNTVWQQSDDVVPTRLSNSAGSLPLGTTAFSEDLVCIKPHCWAAGGLWRWEQLWICLKKDFFYSNANRRKTVNRNLQPHGKKQPRETEGEQKQMRISLLTCQRKLGLFNRTSDYHWSPP